MEHTISELLETYSSKYSEHLRDLAQAYCGATTRLGGVDGAALHVSREDVRAIAQEQKVDVDTLRCAIADYSIIEGRSVAMHLLQGRNAA